MENNKVHRQTVEVNLLTAHHISRELKNLPYLFGETLTVHMKRRSVTNEALAEALNVSVRKISSLRNAEVPSITLRELTAICVSLHLEPELSEDLIAKAGIHVIPVAGNIAYRMVLRTMYQFELEDCNQALIEAGYEPLTKL